MNGYDKWTDCYGEIVILRRLSPNGFAGRGHQRCRWPALPPIGTLAPLPVYYPSGIAIILCDLLSWVLLRLQAITFKVGVATGTVLWVTAIYALLRSRQFLRELAAD